MDMNSLAGKALAAHKRKEAYEKKEWYTIRALLGNQ